MAFPCVETNNLVKSGSVTAPGRTCTERGSTEAQAEADDDFAAGLRGTPARVEIADPFHSLLLAQLGGTFDGDDAGCLLCFEDTALEREVSAFRF